MRYKGHSLQGALFLGQSQCFRAIEVLQLRTDDMLAKILQFLDQGGWRQRWEDGLALDLWSGVTDSDLLLQPLLDEDVEPALGERTRIAGAHGLSLLGTAFIWAPLLCWE